MGRILDRYILRQVIANWLGVTSVLLVILLTNQVARVLDRAAEFQYPRGVVLELIGLSAVQNVAVLLPVGLLLGVVLAFGRLYHDSEMAAASSCGVGPARIYGPMLALTLLVTALLGWLTLVVAPSAAARVYDLRSAATRAGQFAALAPGKFRSFGGGATVVYAEAVDADGLLERVFVKRNRGNHYEIAVARHARHTISADGSLHTMTLYDGERYEGMPGSAQFRIVRFAENVIPVRLPAADATPTALEAKPTLSLLASSSLKERAELHWRIALPLMAVVLTLLAVPLSRLRPRQGRYSRVWIAIVIYFVYISLASAAKAWIERGTVPETLGLWWVHAVVVVLALLVILVPGWWARLRHRDVAAAVTA
ncbi:MAG: LPS export ABC transporter permease LptF [Sinobacteraceae bacterium]|nr:LPS export ABC transporter permease LptF [Nevskiaceae bacterium]